MRLPWRGRGRGPGRGRRTIATRLLAWFLIMASLPLAAVLFLTTRNDAAKLRRDGFATVTHTAEVKADRIEQYIKERREAAQALARTPAMVDRYQQLEAAGTTTGVDSAAYAQVEAALRPFFLGIAQQLDERSKSGRVLLDGQRQRGGCPDLAVPRL